MTVYLGAQGEIELKRIFNGGKLRSRIDRSDVNATRKRFSFDFEHGQLVTGDQIQIKSILGRALDFINGYTDSSVTKYIHVDELGGIRLYNSFSDAVNGGTANALSLAVPASAIDISVQVSSSSERVLAQVSSFEINTERETVDTTVLSDEFRTRVNTLISGSGRITAFWEYTGSDSQELPMYLYELAHRTKVGSNFKGRFYIKKADYSPGGVPAKRDDQVWWDVEGVITAAAIQFSPDSTVQITADFVTTGEIKLRMQLLPPPDALLQENSDDILLDQDSGAKLLLEQDV